MSKFGLSKVSAILIGFSIIVGSVSGVFAQNPRQVVIPKANRIATSTATGKLNPPRINITNIEKQIAGMREKLASKEAALKLKLQTFRDQKKATAAARINANLNQINQNQTRQMQKHLDTMTSILDKLEGRINKLTPDIKDPASAKAAVASAREVIATASAAVSTQAQKDYTIQVTSESRIVIDAKTQRDKLRMDLLALRKAVIDAKQAVANAIRVAKAGPKEGTNSGQQ